MMILNESVRKPIRWAWSIFYHAIEKRCDDIPKQFYSCSNFGH